MALSGRMRLPFAMYGCSKSSGSCDAALMERVASGDRAALALLYDNLAPSMMRTAYRLLRAKREAEDLVHDVFIEAWANAHRYDAKRSSVRSWLMLRLRSRALDRLRSERRNTRLALDERQHYAHHELDSDSRALQGMIAELAPELREVIELAYFAGYSSREIASELAIPPGTVKSRVSRALAILRKRLQLSVESEA